MTSLGDERSQLDMDVTVVDNASGDGSPELVASTFPWVRLVRNERNVGFGAAHNQVLTSARGRHLLVLNSDTRVLPGALRTLVDFLDDHPAEGGAEQVDPGRPRASTLSSGRMRDRNPGGLETFKHQAYCQ